MKYVDAGYAICLAVLFVYAVGLVLRRRRLERAVAARRGTAPAEPLAAGGAPPDPFGGAAR